MEQEIWKDIPGYEGLYQASTLGRIKSLRNNKNRKCRLLKFIHPHNYCVVRLRKQNKVKTFGVHRLVGLTFIENHFSKPEINHIDGDKSNNKISNLEWVTRSENILHNFRKLGYKTVTQIAHPFLGKFGGKAPNSKKVIQYDKNFNKIKVWESIIEAQTEFNIKGSEISRVCKGIRNRKTAGGFIWRYF